jgi:hypothetical protein
MQAAHDAAEIPLFSRQILNRLEGTRNTGAKKDEKPDATDQDNPAKENRQGTEMIEGRVNRSERFRERSLQDSETGPAGLLQKGEQYFAPA